MHRRAREIIAPGVNELDVFNELQAVAVREYGEMLTGTGNDYASGERGGRTRAIAAIAAGELYILDLGPAFRGYFADNTRVTAVGPSSRPTSSIKRLGAHPARSSTMVEQHRQARARVAVQLFEEAHQWLNQAVSRGSSNITWATASDCSRTKRPHLNPHWDDAFESGEVFAVEPGLYGEGLRAGIRLENNYLVTETGVELLTPFPHGARSRQLQPPRSQHQALRREIVLRQQDRAARLTIRR